jgi:ribose transport system substrate-binding protein
LIFNCGNKCTQTGTYAGGLKAMEDILVAHPDVNVVITESDSFAYWVLLKDCSGWKTNDILIACRC